MKNYVDEAMLYCIKNNNIYPQDCDVNNSKSMWITFGAYGMTLYRKSGRSSLFIKYVSDYKNKTAKEINNELNTQEWQKEF